MLTHFIVCVRLISFNWFPPFMITLNINTSKSYNSPVIIFDTDIKSVGLWNYS